jgi:type IV fimbrial biogenesis protein FimT
MIELMVTVSVAAVVLAVAIPSFEAVINSNRLSTAANEMMAAVQSARMEAIRSSRRTVLCLSPAPEASAPACNAAGATGWIVFRDDNKDGNPAASEVVRATTIRQQVQTKASAAFGNRVTFRPDGLAYDAGGAPLAAAIAFCVPARQPAQNILYVNIAGGSRVAIVKNSGGGSCPSTVNNNNPPPAP